MDYYGNRYYETFSYTIISSKNWAELYEYEYITDGSIELSSDSDLKVSGSFSFVGPEPPPQGDMLRVGYSFMDDDGNYTFNVLATLYISFSSLKMQDSTQGLLYTGSINGVSILSDLQRKKYGQPFIVKSNESAIYKAVTIIRDMGLRVEYTPDSTILSEDHTFSASSTYLEIINWLCSIAKYNDVYVDAFGVIQLHPKKKPEELPENEIIVFRNDDKSIMYPEIDTSNDWQNSCNVVKLIYNTDKTNMIATAKNLSGSKISLDVLNNREQTLVEDIGELGKTGTRVENLLNKAEEKLKEESKETEYVTFSHAYIPMSLFDGVRVKYSEFDWLGSVDNISIDLGPAVRTQTKLKRVIESTIEIEKHCDVFRDN